jgi:hypothetical protein
MIKAKAFRTFITMYYIFKTERLSASFELTLHKQLIKLVMTYACPAWELVADTYLLKLQRPQNKVLRTTGNFPRCTLVSDFFFVTVFFFIYCKFTIYSIVYNKSNK